jgi:7-dehydrocholesterol reductase
MEDLIMSRSTEPGATATATSVKGIPLPEKHIVWGRTGAGRSWLRSLVASLPVVLAPLTSITTFIALHEYGGSFSLFAAAVAEQGFWSVCFEHRPQLTPKGVFAVVCWIGLQALLFRYLPGEVRPGQYTPAGHLLTYRLNGLFAWIVTHVLYFGLGVTGVLDPAFISRNWSSLIAALNVVGLAVSICAFAKAYLSSTHPNDRKFSGKFVFYHSISE